MSEYDLVITGGKVVSPSGTVQADVAAKDGRVAAIGEPGAFTSAARTIDADGLHVLPGIMDLGIETLNREDASVSFLDYHHPIQVGADADFALVDLDAERVVTPEYMRSGADWDLCDGWNLKGWPTHTIVRGEVVMERGEIVGSPEHGEYMPRPPLT